MPGAGAILIAVALLHSAGYTPYAPGSDGPPARVVVPWLLALAAASTVNLALPVAVGTEPLCNLGGTVVAGAFAVGILGTVGASWGQLVADLLVVLADAWLIGNLAPSPSVAGEAFPLAVLLLSLLLVEPSPVRRLALVCALPPISALLDCWPAAVVVRPPSLGGGAALQVAAGCLLLLQLGSALSAWARRRWLGRVGGRVRSL